MRRFALAATVLAVAACSSSKKDGGDHTPPAPPVVTAPLDGAHLVASDLDQAGQVRFTGIAEALSVVDVQVDAQSVGTANASSGGSWSLGAPIPNGSHTVRARATDAAGNVSDLGAAVAFSVDATRLASPIPAGGAIPVTGWGQTVPVSNPDPTGLGALFPDQANSWVLGPDFALLAGYGLQYASGLVLYTGTPTSPVSHGSLWTDLNAPAFAAFPGNQTAAEAVFLTPLFGASEGVKTAAAATGIGGVPAITGTSAFLNGTSDSRLSRTLSLAAGETYTFTWTHQAVLLAGNLGGAPAASYQVVLRDPTSGAALGAPLFSSSTDVARATPSVTRAGLPTSVVLSFELRSAAFGYAELDDVALAASTGPVALANGDFEAGLSGWQANGGAETQNVRSGARAVGATGSTLQVTRTFYAPPAADWGRMVDVFENTGVAQVSTSAVYVTLLGGNLPLAAGITGGGAVVGWDADAFVRDVGVVFGSGTAYVADADPVVFVVHPLVVAPGEKVALVHFVVQRGEATGGPTSQPVDVPAGTAASAADVLAGFRTIEAYRADLEAGVLGLVLNL